MYGTVISVPILCRLEQTADQTTRGSKTCKESFFIKVSLAKRATYGAWYVLLQSQLRQQSNACLDILAQHAELRVL